MFKLIQVVTGLYDKWTNANSQTIRSTHIVSCDKCKLNPSLKLAKHVQKISFQLSADTGKNKVRSFYNYFYNIYMNLILTLFMCWYAVWLLYWINALLHKSQQYGHWPIHMGCVIMWLFIINILHTSQYGCSPQRKRLCVTRLRLWMNVSLHPSQQYGRSPLCKRLCVIRLPFWVNVLLHTSQQYGRSTLCICLCYKATLMNECLTAHITAIWALTTM
jgi:hypothetical protein